MSKSTVSNVRPRVQIFFDPATALTQQHFRDECDVNFIMSKYSSTSLLNHSEHFQGNYGDFTDVQDYQTSLNEVMKAQEMFMSLPSRVRNRFANDPSEFLDFVGREENREEMKSLGLLKEVPVIEAKNAVENGAADGST